MKDCNTNLVSATSDGWIALMAAVLAGHLGVVKYLVEDCRFDPIIAADKSGIALMFAAYRGHINIVKYFV